MVEIVWNIYHICTSRILKMCTNFNSFKQFCEVLLPKKEKKENNEIKSVLTSININCVDWLIKFLNDVGWNMLLNLC